jgi:hypothetical protein
MMSRFFVVASALWVGLAASNSFAYPGGTPEFQTDVTPFCAACHSSLEASALAGAGDRAQMETAKRKHLAAIASGEKAYGKLTEEERATLVGHIQAVDANSTIKLEFPPTVRPGETFQVTVKLTGGAGPVVGVGLVDRAHRWYARSAVTAGWEIVGAPTIIGPNGVPQSDWIENRPERFERNLTYVNVTGVESDATTGKWAKSKVIFTMQAPDKAGEYPLVGVYFYGTEKASPLGFEEHPIYGKIPRGTYTGKSGRVKFSEVNMITVK